MWYLVVPPIVVVLSLLFLLWYLSRKGSDPIIAEKVRASEETAQKISFPRTKEFFLRILEKIGQRFKVVSLRAHNALHSFTQSVKASRVKVHTAVFSEKQAPQEEKNVVQAAEVAPTFPEPPVRQISRTDNLDTILETPIVRRERSGLGKNVLGTPKSDVPRPMVSETMTRPEPKKRTIHPDAFREEEMIARIAKDPKDFTAYEALGDYYLETGNIKDAKECYRQVLKLSPVHRMVKIKIRRLEKLLTRGGE